MKLGRHRPELPELITVAAMVGDAQRQEAAGTLPDVVGRAQLAGLLEDPLRRARLTPLEGESILHHGVYLVGKLMTFMERTGRPIHRDFLVPTASVYCAALAERAANPDVDLRDPRLEVHTYAMVRLERKLGGPLPVEHESLLLTWLVNQIGLRPGDDAGQAMGRRRARRHAKLFPDLAPERPPEAG